MKTLTVSALAAELGMGAGGVSYRLRRLAETGQITPVPASAGSHPHEIPEEAAQAVREYKCRAITRPMRAEKPVDDCALECTLPRPYRLRKGGGHCLRKGEAIKHSPVFCAGCALADALNERGLYQAEAQVWARLEALVEAEKKKPGRAPTEEAA